MRREASLIRSHCFGTRHQIRIKRFTMQNPGCFLKTFRQIWLHMKRTITLFGTLILFSAQCLHAQIPGAGANPMSTALLKLFGNNTNFSAKADIRVSGKSPKESMSMTVSMATLNGKLRSEMDMSQMKNAMLSPQVIQQMKQMGADKTVNIIRPDKKVSYTIYPTLKAYLEQPLSDSGKEPKITTTALGKETVDGHACTKSKIVMTDENGKTEEATVWNATDLKNFPVQMQMQEQGTTVVMSFKDVQFAKPDAKQFEPPAGFSRQTNMSQLQQLMMQRMMGNQNELKK